MAAGPGASLAGALEELQAARLQLRSVLARTPPALARKEVPGRGTRLQFLGLASHGRLGLFLARVSFRAWAGAVHSASLDPPAAVPLGREVLAERLFHTFTRRVLSQALSAWRLCLRRATRLRGHERLMQEQAAQAARAERTQQDALQALRQRIEECKGRMEQLCTRLNFSTAAALLLRSLLVWRYHCREEQLEAVAEKIGAAQTETMLLGSTEVDKALSLLLAREAALVCELAMPLTHGDAQIFDLISALGPSLRLMILGPCWLRWRLRALLGLSWLRQRRVHISLCRLFLPRFEACQLRARVLRAWHRGCGGCHQRLPIWFQERCSAMAGAFQWAASHVFRRQRLCLLRSSLGAWFWWGVLLPKQQRLRAITGNYVFELAQVTKIVSPERSPAPSAARALQNLQVPRLLDVVGKLAARAALRAWRLQVAKECAFNAMVLLPQEEDLEALEALDLVSVSSASSSQRWHRAQRFEGDGIRSFSFSGSLAQPPPRLQQPGHAPADPEERPSRPWSPLQEDLDDME
ncbi:gpmA [Symbiodinium natans]|uniref:GpmA protein n=1 Tax=Symbiodinium natans TaxID=878477 RepID=A0A812QSM1_9DINO|nr:gpmA [Symbiodinium natans]